MDKNVKNVLIVVAALFLGLALFRLGQFYFVKYQVEQAIGQLEQDLDKSAKDTQRRLAASQRDREQKALAVQVEQERRNAAKAILELEANLQCASSVDTGKCVCYDRRTKRPVQMSLEQCRVHVER